jgi:two-component system, sensor histidine kinase
MSAINTCLRLLTLPAIVILACMAVYPLEADEIVGKNILVINSYDSSFSWTRDQNSGFVKEVKKYNPDTQFYIEYLDAKRVDVSLYQQAFANFLKAKYQHRTISLIYATDDIALEFAQAFAGLICMGKSVPIVASGINNHENLNKSLHPTTDGIREVQSAKALVTLALKQNPKTTRIVVVCDDSEVGRDIANDIEIQTRAISVLPMERIPNNTWENTLRYIDNFGPNTLFLLGLYAVDSESFYIQPFDVATQVALRANGPVYAFHDVFTSSPCVVGGYVNSGTNQGQLAGRMAVRSIGGKTARHLDANEKPGFTWTFNYEAMKRFGIPESTLPKGSILNGKPTNYITSHPIISISLVLGIAAQTLLILYLLLNIRKRVAATAALRQSEARMRLLLENSPLAVFISDRDGRIVLLNTQIRKMLGYDISEIRTLDALKEKIMPDPAYRAKISERLVANSNFANANGIAPLPVEYVAKAKNGRSVEVEMYYAEAGNLFFRILHDVTERNRVMRELRQATEAALAANEAKSRFIANVSHEIRTPMNGILGMVQLLRDTEFSTDQREYIETIDDSCNLLLTVINDILDLSKIEAGQMKLSLEPVNLKNFLKSVTGIVGPTVEAKGLEFIFDFSGAMPDAILCDPNRLKQVLLNILVNASKFTDKGQVELHAAGFCMSGEKFRLHFDVVDTGIGIPHDIQETIFEPFIQGDSSQTRKVGGTGLGLAISRRLVQIMGGEITLKSEPNVGSTFSFDIVVEILPSTAAKTASSERIDTTTARDFPLSILVAEDNAVNQKVVGMMLRKMGYETDIVENGIEAVEIAARKHFDVILMDVQMPLMDGITAATQIRKMHQPDEQPHIFALTAHAMNDDAQRCLESGMNGHLTKPLRVSALREALVNAYEDIHAEENARGWNA